MSGHPTRTAQRGQATVEHVGIAVIVALLLASLSIWVSQNVRPPPAPPAISSLADRLDGPPPGSPYYLFQHRGLPLSAMRGRNDETIGRFFRFVGGFTRDLVTIGGPALVKGFVVRIKDRAVDMARDPIGTIKNTLQSLGETDPNVFAAVRDRIGDIGDYVDSLRHLSQEEMIEKVAEDLGAAGADFAIDRGRALMLKQGIKHLRDRASKRPDDPTTDEP